MEKLHGAHDVLVLGGRDQKSRVPLLTPTPQLSFVISFLFPSSCPLPSLAPVPHIPHFPSQSSPFPPHPSPSPNSRASAVPLPSLPG